MSTSNVYNTTNANAIAIANADWREFEEWLDKKEFTEKYKYDVLLYARKYAVCLLSGSLKDVDDEHGLKGLANLAKFLGIYTAFKKLKDEAGLKWASSTGEEAFMAIYNGHEVVGISDWVEEIKERFSREIWFPVVYMALTGLRTGEAILSLNKIANEGLYGYLNEEMGVLEHFKDRQFIRKTKKAFISVVWEGLVQELEHWNEKTSYSKLRKKLERKGISVRFYDTRKWFNTVLRENGIEQEMCNLLCGRLPRNIFLRSYWRPELDTYFEKVRAIMGQYHKKWLT